MIAIILTLFFTSIELLLGYFVPVAFLLKATLSSDKEGMKRWCTHFLFLAVLKSTLFCAMHSVDLGSVEAIIRGSMIAVVFMMKKVNLEDTVYTQVDKIQTRILDTNLEAIRHIVKQGLVTLNLY